MPVHSIHDRRPAERYDLIVIGSGAAGLSSALSAAQMGLKVCVVEASEYIGGTSAWSGGCMWIPQNHLANAAGIADSCEQVLTYLRSVANRHQAADPFNSGDLLLNYSCDSCVPLDFMPPVEPGEYGKVYEIRTYQPTLNGLAPTIEKWREAVPVREQYSHLTCAMYSLDGPTRFTHIWPYESANARAEARAKSVADGNWPPAGCPAFLRPEMKSTLAVPMAF